MEVELIKKRLAKVASNAADVNWLDAVDVAKWALAYIEAAEAEKVSRLAACSDDVKEMIEQLGSGGGFSTGFVHGVRAYILKAEAEKAARVEPEPDAKLVPSFEECIDVLNRNGHMGVPWEPTAACLEGDVFRFVIDERGVREMARFYLDREAKGGA